MKQFKHQNILIYYTKYKSSLAILNTNRTKRSFLKLLIHQNDPPLAAITASQMLGILSTKDWRKTEHRSAQFSCKSCQSWATLVGCFALTFRSSSWHTSSMGFKSTDRTSKSIKRRTCCSSLLLMYLWQSLLLWFGSLSCMSTNPWATSRVSDGIVWYCNLQW